MYFLREVFFIFSYCVCLNVCICVCITHVRSTEPLGFQGLEINTIDITILLNTKDIFEEKIQKYPLKICFSEYTGR